MNRVCAALVFTVLALTAGCGTGTISGQATATSQNQAPTTPQSPAASVTTPADAGSAPTYALLSRTELTAALLAIEDLPAGYSQEPPTVPGTKTFCDYVPPFTEKIYVSREFTKGAGASGEVLSVGLRQYESAGQARAALDALAKALTTCRTETYQGTTYEYAPMSAPKVGEQAVGVRITVGGTALLQNFVLVGPTLVSTGGGGLVQADADEIARLLGAQVQTYEAAAAE